MRSSSLRLLHFGVLFSKRQDFDYLRSLNSAMFVQLTSQAVSFDMLSQILSHACAFLRLVQLCLSVAGAGIVLCSLHSTHFQFGLSLVDLVSNPSRARGPARAGDTHSSSLDP